MTTYFTIDEINTLVLQGHQYISSIGLKIIDDKNNKGSSFLEDHFYDFLELLEVIEEYKDLETTDDQLQQLVLRLYSQVNNTCLYYNGLYLDTDDSMFSGSVTINIGTNDFVTKHGAPQTIVSNITFSNPVVVPNAVLSTQAVNLSQLQAAIAPGNAIENQNASAQTSANFWIDGGGRLGGNLVVDGNSNISGKNTIGSTPTIITNWLNGVEYVPTNNTGGVYAATINQILASPTSNTANQYYANYNIATAATDNTFGVLGGDYSQIVIRGTATATIGYTSIVASPFFNNTGSIGTLYGRYIQPQKQNGVTTGYGEYQAGALDLNYFAGNVGIGTSTPSALLQVTQSANGTGAVTVVSGQNTIVGNGSQFLNTFRIGDVITVNSQTRTINTITDNFNMTVSANWTVNSFLPTVVAISTSISISAGNLPPNTYRYVITALSGSGQETVISNELTAVLPSTGQVAILWNSIIGAVSYNIYRSLVSGVYTGVPVYNTTNYQTFVDTGASTSTGTPPSSSTAIGASPYTLAGGTRFQVFGNGNILMSRAQVTNAPVNATDVVRLSDISVFGGGTVTSISGVNTNGFTWSIANGTTTPALTLTLQTANTSQAGQISSTDWNTFNNKLSTATATSTYQTLANLETTLSNSTTLYPSGSAVTTALGTKQATITLTTTGTSGAATLTGATLNIPNYAGATYTFSTGLTNTSGTVTVNTSQNINTLSNLTGNGFIKTSGGAGALSIDTNTYLTANQSITLSGDVTGSGTTSIATTLATVNTNTGSFGSSTSIPSFTVNGKGLITAASGNVVIAPAGTLSGTILNATVVTSSLTTIGTLVGGSIPYSLVTGGPTAVSGTNPTASLGLTAINGVATTFMRSDGAPALNQAIVPTWTGIHTFQQSISANTTSADGLVIQNSFTATGTITDPYVPRIRFTGTFWNATVTNQIDWINEVRPINAATGNITWASRLSTSGTGAYTDQMILTTSGALSITNGLNVGGTITAVGNITGATIFATNVNSSTFAQTSSSATTAFRNQFMNAGATTWFTFGQWANNVTNSSGLFNNVAINTIYNQTSGALGTDLLLARTETAVGSGAQLFIDMQVGGSSKFSISNKNLFSFAGVAGTAYQVPQVNSTGTAMVWSTLLSKPHTIFTPITAGTVSLINNQYNIINPSGSLVALTVNLPSSPANNDCVFIKFTQAVTTVTYGNGTVVDGITAPTAGGLTVLVYDSGSTSWY